MPQIKQWQAPRYQTLFNNNAIRPGCEPKIIDHGSKKNNVIVLIHGLTDSPYFMEAIGERFALMGFNVLIPLLPGHGLKEPQGMKGVTLEQWQQEIDLTVEDAKQLGNKISIGGLSTGGTLSVWKAQKSPQEINGGIFLFSAALDIAGKQGDFKEKLLRTNFIRPLIATFEDKNQQPLVGNDPDDNPYRYSRMDIDGAAQLSEAIKLVDNAILSQPLFVAHSEDDSAADIEGVEELIRLHKSNPTKTDFFRIGKNYHVPHASVVLAEDVMSANQSPLEPKNPFFDLMMNRIQKFLEKFKYFDSIPESHLGNIPFKPNTSNYKPENAYWMAYFSSLAYKKQSKTDPTPDTNKILAELKSKDQNFLTVEGFNRESSQAIIIQHEDYVVAAFRGTDELVDWIDNIKAFPTQGPLGKVHSGFYNAFLDVWKLEKMWEKIKQLQNRGQGKIKRPLWITGHSLGGAIATIAAAWLAEQKITLYGVYTYGQPRCGDESFQIAFDSKLGKKFFRFQNNNDIVTRVPSRLMGYEHVGKFIYITQEKELKTDVSFWYQFVDRVEGVVENIFDQEIKLDQINDHKLIEGYIAGIEAWGTKLPEN
ncbi:MAG: alpha/beta hydrolase [Xenococcus sp. MO_188.B8]|nr:alpha/beta hydrolase [Xenococcus sp. MO_188.B8]